MFKKMAILKPKTNETAIVENVQKRQVAIIDDTLLTFVNSTKPVITIAEPDISLSKIYEELSAA